MSGLDIRTMPAFCINMDKRVDRWEWFQSQPGFKHLPNIQRFSAVDGSKLDSLHDPRISVRTKYNLKHDMRRSHDEIDTIGAVGASLSHSTIWKTFLEQYPEQPYCIVFEDDSNLPSNVVELVELKSKDLIELQKGFDIWLLSCNFLTYDVKPVSKSWSQPGNFWGFSSYIITRDGAKSMLQDAIPVEMHVDRLAKVKCELGLLNVLIHNSLRLGNVMGKSDIQLKHCRICDVPDKLQDVRMVNSYFLFAIIAYSALISLLFIRSNKI
jgi:GR25 family glycosyltransferase involved in LPS biosynthesis